VIPPRWRAPLLALGFASLAFGVAGGLVRLGAGFPAPQGAIALHGALMAPAFFGTVIGLERAVALGRPWAYGAPLCAGAGGLALVANLAPAGLALLVAAAAIFCTANVLVVAKQASLETATLLAGALAWLAGSAFLAAGRPAEPWWIAFFALTIGAERLELSRYLKRSRGSRAAFIALMAVVLLAPLAGASALQGGALFLLALWFFRYDLARVTLRQSRLPRYIAACLLAGYFWLALGGVLLASGGARDAALHAVFLGFVVSMVFGHAPVILPAALRISFPYGTALYAPLALLHASLALRVAGDMARADALVLAGAWGNAAGIALFVVTAAALVFGRAARERSQGV